MFAGGIGAAVVQAKRQPAVAEATVVADLEHLLVKPGAFGLDQVVRDAAVALGQPVVPGADRVGLDFEAQPEDGLFRGLVEADGVAAGCRGFGPAGQKQCGAGDSGGGRAAQQ
ncbi:hypothetical protein GCM10027598_20720 [Amycolatopsis oliviviridis]|uniref:Uncharacterized protein n=1 Tax=Amycolatopsis oliviviridis TaxID=1471590 RepID=A0ABQ3LGB3_9PSEU|nr:hypothetical protein GCM10017790_28370 [Amycolatopsis oliviviridis]